MVSQVIGAHGTGRGATRTGLLLGLALLWCLVILMHPLLHAAGQDGHCLLCAALQAVAIAVGALVLLAPAPKGRLGLLAVCPAAHYTSLVRSSRGPPPR